MLQAELERQERELKEMQALHDNISGAKPAAASASGDNAGASASGSAMDTAQDGEATENTEQEEVDGRSVFVGNVSLSAAAPLSSVPHRLTRSHQVDYGATPEEIQQHFQACGAINRVTILCDKFTGHPKGYVASFQPNYIHLTLASLQICLCRVRRGSLSE